jgi:hypothetical protein
MNDDDTLRRLLNDAVSEIEPADRLEELRASVRPNPSVIPMVRSRSWYAATGIVATAAVIGVVAFVTSVAGNQSTNVGPATDVSTGGPSATATATDTAVNPSTAPTSPGSATPAATGSAQAGTKAVAVYYVGSDPSNRPVLFREFHQAPDYPANVAGSDRDLLTVAVRDAMTTLPLDPDYGTPWIGTAQLDHASYDTTGAGYTLRIALKQGAPAQRPAGMTAAEARSAIQQLVYTAQAAIGKRAPVTFTIGRHVSPAHPTLLGIDISHPISAGSVLGTLSLVNISDPNQGAVVSGHLTVTGVNNAFEGSSVIYLERAGRRYLVTPTIGGMGGNRLWPWTVELDLSKVEPGTYTLVARNDDPSGQGHPPVDTRLIEVK